MVALKRSFPLGSVIALSALAAALRMAFAWFPNVTPAYFVVFVAGAVLGPLGGAAVGALSMAVTNLFLSGAHPVMLVNTPAMALVGVAGALVARFVNLGQRRNAPRAFTAVLAGFIGLFVTLAFSVAADAATYLLFHRSGERVLEALVVAGLVFNVLPAFANTILFAAATHPVLTALRHAGLVWWRPGPTRGERPIQAPQESRAG